MTEIKELSDTVKMAAIKCRVRLWLMLTSWYMNFALKKKIVTATWSWLDGVLRVIEN